MRRAASQDRERKERVFVLLALAVLFLDICIGSAINNVLREGMTQKL